MKDFIVFILAIAGVCILSYYHAFDALTLTGGLAWLGLLSIVYLVGDILERLGDWIIKKHNNKE